jgi:hypothetical protein
MSGYDRRKSCRFRVRNKTNELGGVFSYNSTVRRDGTLAFWETELHNQTRKGKSSEKYPGLLKESEEEEEEEEKKKELHLWVE